MDLIAQRKEKVFLFLVGLFLGTLGIINILGLTRFVDLGFAWGDSDIALIVPLGVLPYPITFLCTDIISEFYGKRRAKAVIWMGLFVNLWILFMLWIGGVLPPHVPLDPMTHLPDPSHHDYAFYQIRWLTAGSVIGSMVAYLVAQLLDVHLFIFWKEFTKGKHLWLRNNGSTLVSQLVDTIIVTSTAFYLTHALPITPGETPIQTLIRFILYSYSFKVVISILATLPCYGAVYFLRRYFDPRKISSSLLNAKPLIKSPIQLN